MMMSVLLAAGVIGGLGLIFGLVLAYASQKFHVEVDPKIVEVIAALPGANCGSCGFPGCGGYAEAIVMKGAAINACSPGGAETVKKIAVVMGQVATTSERKVARIHCQSGGKKNTFFRYDYQGIPTCKAAILVTGGPNLCNYGCVFQNDCVAACLFDALKVDENGMRIVDEDKCTGCGLCAKACPRKLIEIVPISKKVHILCSSRDKGAEAKKLCGNSTACISCTMCVKKCPVQAITMMDNLAVIDYEKCITCGLCATVCPTKAIVDKKAPRKKAAIIDEKCIGCTICAKACPVQCITGELKQVHVIDKVKCIGCEICFNKCPKKAIVMG